MFRKSNIIGVALLVGVFLSTESKAEVLGIKPSQRFYSAKLSLQTGKWAFSNNKLWMSKENHGTHNEVANYSSVGPRIYILESCGSLGGAVVGAIPSAYFTMYVVCALCMEDYESAERLVITSGIIYFIGIPIGAACGAALTGKWLHQEISFVNAFKGALLGGLIGEGLSATACMLTGNDIGANVFGIEGSIVWRLGTVSGSVVGYNVFDKGEK